MLDWHSCQICYPLEIKISLFIIITSILYVCEQRRLWRDCADAQARLSKSLNGFFHKITYFNNQII